MHDIFMPLDIYMMLTQLPVYTILDWILLALKSSCLLQRWRKTFHSKTWIVSFPVKPIPISPNACILLVLTCTNINKSSYLEELRVRREKQKIKYSIPVFSRISEKVRLLFLFPFFPSFVWKDLLLFSAPQDYRASSTLLSFFVITSTLNGCPVYRLSSYRVRQFFFFCSLSSLSQSFLLFPRGHKRRPIIT